MPASRRPVPAHAATASRTRPDSLVWLTGSAILLGAVIAATPGWSQEDAAEGSADGVTVSHGYSTFGDLKYGPDFKHLDYVNPEAPKGGEIAIWAQGTFDTFNPYTIAGNAGALSNIGYETLLTTVADDPTALYCLVCETLEYPENLAWVIFNMRPEATFSDGSPLTAEDLKFSHEIFMEQGLPSFRAAFGTQIESVEVLDTYRVKFTFAEDAPPRDRIDLAAGIPILSKAWFEESGARIDETRLEPGLGSGPYALENFNVGRRIVYARNPDYWGEDLPINVGRNNFDSIRVEYFADSTAAFEAFKAGEYTFRAENSSLQWATGYDFPAVEKGWVIVEELEDGSLTSGQSFVFNLRRDKFQDPRVREAIGLMFNFEWSNETLFYGLYERVKSFWGNSDMEATGKPNEAELALLEPLVEEGLLDASILTEDALVPPTSGPRQTDRRNLRRASELLDAAGWTVDDDGRRRKDGRPLEVVFLESSPTFDRVINPFVQNLERLGIDARLERVDPAQEEQRRGESDFDIATQSFSLGLEPSTGLRQWLGSEGAEESNRNLMGLEDPAVDRLIDVIVGAETEEEMKNGVRTLDRVLRAKLFWVPQWFKGVHTVAYWDMFDHPEQLPPYSRGELDFWWYDAEAADALRAAGALR